MFNDKEAVDVFIEIYLNRTLDEFYYQNYFIRVGGQDLAAVINFCCADGNLNVYFQTVLSKQ